MPRLLPLLVAELVEEVLVVLQFHLLFVGELEGAQAAVEDMLAGVQHPADQRNGFFTFCTLATAPAFSVEPHIRLASISCCPSALKTDPRPALKWGVLQGTDGGLDRIEGGPSLLQHGMPALQGQGEGLAVGLLAGRVISEREMVPAPPCTARAVGISRGSAHPRR